MYQNHPNINPDYAEKNGDNIKKSDYNARKLDLTNSNTVKIMPFVFVDEIKNFSLSWNTSLKPITTKFTGDIENLAERDIVDSGTDISADVIKIAHHGSQTSSLKVFMQAVDPDYAVISVGSPNDYGHPHKETLELLDILDIDVYRTDINGDIVFFSDGTNISVVTEKGVG